MKSFKIDFFLNIFFTTFKMSYIFNNVAIYNNNSNPSIYNFVNVGNLSSSYIKLDTNNSNIVKGDYITNTNFSFSSNNVFTNITSTFITNTSFNFLNISGSYLFGDQLIITNNTITNLTAVTLTGTNLIVENFTSTSGQTFKMANVQPNLINITSSNPVYRITTFTNASGTLLYDNGTNTITTLSGLNLSGITNIRFNTITGSTVINGNNLSITNLTFSTANISNYIGYNLTGNLLSSTSSIVRTLSLTNYVSATTMNITNFSGQTSYFNYLSATGVSASLLRMTNSNVTASNDTLTSIATGNITITNCTFTRLFTTRFDAVTNLIFKNAIYINGSANATGLTYNWWKYGTNINNGGTAFGSVTSSGGNYSLSTNGGRILLFGFIHFTSSIKVKKLLNRVEGKILDYLIEKFKSIEFKKYIYKDFIKYNSNIVYYGMIAEEIQKVFPQYINYDNFDFIPNIMQSSKIEIIDEKIYIIGKYDKTNSRLLRIACKNNINFTDVEIQYFQDRVEILNFVNEKVELLNDEDIFVYGTYECVPDVNKTALFEINLIMTTYLINSFEILENRLEYLEKEYLKKVL